MKLFRFLFFGLLAFELTACADQGPRSYPLNRYRLGALLGSSKHFENEGTVVLGFRSAKHDYLEFGFYKFNEVTGKREGDLTWCGVGMCAQDSTSPPCKEGTAYQLFAMPPGLYGLAYVHGYSSARAIAKASKVYVTKSRSINGIVDVQLIDPELAPNTPTFKVNAGDLIYVGNFVLDISTPATVITFQKDEGNAKAAADEMNFAKEMIVRPWTPPPVKSRR